MSSAGPSRTDDATGLLEEVMAEVQPGHRRDRAAEAPGVFGGSVAPALASAALVAEVVLAGAVFGVGGAPGSIVGGIGHGSGLRCGAARAASGGSD